MYRKISLSGSMWAFLILALTALVGVFLYREVLHFTFFWDDVNFIRVIQEKSLVEIFTTPSALTHYRPLALLPLKLAEGPTGQVPALPMHLLAIILHILNGWMVGLVAWRIARILVDEKVLPEGAFSFLAAGVGRSFGPGGCHPVQV